MENYRTSSHGRYDLKYHFVWVTKYRRQVLNHQQLRHLVVPEKPILYRAGQIDLAKFRVLVPVGIGSLVWSRRVRGVVRAKRSAQARLA